MKIIADRPIKVGDRIKVITTFMGLCMANQKGTVREIVYNDIGVEFDTPFLEGHNLHGKIKNNPNSGRYGKIHEVKKLYARTHKDLFGSKI